MEGSLTVKRQPGDYRSVSVSVDELDGFHMDTVTGGVGRRMAGATLCAYMWCSSIPAGAEFGHSCRHGEGPHNIKVVVCESDNPGPLYKEIRKRVDQGWGKRKAKAPQPFPSRTRTFRVGHYGTRTVTVESGREYEVRPLAPNKQKHRGRRCIVMDYAGDKVEVKFADTGRLGYVDTYDLWAKGLTQDAK